MARIKKKGLDYFPLNTDFIHDRAVRRLMKREGDSALGILVEILSYIYAGEGYYVRADRLFYEDLSAGLYEKSADDVERIVRLAVEYGLFDAVLFERSCILTSVEIQRQYLFSTRRRSISHLEVGYCLLADDEPADNKDDAKGTPAVKSEKQGRKNRREEYEPEEVLVDEVEDGELPEMQPRTVTPPTGRRRGRKPAEYDEDRDFDILGEEGIGEIRDELESEGREVLNELKRRGR